MILVFKLETGNAAICLKEVKLVKCQISLPLDDAKSYIVLFNYTNNTVKMICPLVLQPLEKKCKFSF